MATQEISTSKTCSCCGAAKSLDQFYRCKACKDGLRGECKECVSNKQAIYNQRNAKRISNKKKSAYYSEGAKEARQKRWANYYQENRERLTKYTREHYASNKEAISLRRKTNRKKVRAQTMAWRTANRDRVRKSTNKWYRANKERLRPSRKAAKAMRRAAGRVSADVVAFLLRAQRNTCPSCRSSLSGGYHLDHRQPIVRGGTNDPGNLQLLCPPCNLEKSAKDPIDFMQSRGYLL